MMEALLNRTLFTLLGVTSNDLISIDHSARACEILPVIPDGQPVILPGQCDPNKPVVQNFDVSRVSYFKINKVTVLITFIQKLNKKMIQVLYKRYNLVY